MNSGINIDAIIRPSIAKPEVDKLFMQEGARAVGIGAEPAMGEIGVDAQHVGELEIPPRRDRNLRNGRGVAAVDLGTGREQRVGKTEDL